MYKLNVSVERLRKIVKSEDELLAVLDGDLAINPDLFDDIVDETPDTTFDPEYKDSDYSKTQKDKRNKEMDEYESFNLMHSNDSTLNKCVLSL